jgi:O-antigen ligase
VLLYRDEDARAVRRVLTGVLWSTAVLVVVESASGLRLLTGRVETVNGVTPVRGSAGLDATRFLVPSKDLALLVCCAALALILRGGSRGLWSRLGPALLVPSVALVFFSFSRRALLAAAAAALFVLLVSSAPRVLVRVLVLVPIASLAVTVLLLVPLPQDSYVARQADAFTTRVVEGLGADARAQDLGIAFRNLENQYAWASFRESPAVGHGLGATYRPDLPGQPFTAADRDFGRTYAHDFYLWLAVKLGLLGVLTFAVFVIAPLHALVKKYAGSAVDRSRLLLPVAAGVVGLCAVNVVSPVFNEPATAVLLGCTLGLLRLRAPRNQAAPPALSHQRISR